MPSPCRSRHLSLLAALPLACGDAGGRTDSTTQDPVTSLPGTATDGPSTGGAAGTDEPPTGSQSATAGETSLAPTTAGPGPDSTDTTATATTPDATTDTTSPISASDPDTTASTGEPACAPTTCSDNLKEVLCGGDVVEQCGPGSYCIDGACVPLGPCEAADLLKGSEGCEFWAVKSQLISAADGSCFAAFVANTWDTPAHIEVTRGGITLPASAIRIPSGQGMAITYEPYDPVAGLPPDEVAIVFLSRGPGGFPDCPVPSGVPSETHVVGTGRGTAFNIKTDVPVAAYQMLPYGGGSVAATSATLLLPTSVWNTNYIAVNAYQKSQIAGDPLFSVVADEDDTLVTIDPKVAVVAGNGVQGGPAGVPLQYTLDRGEFIQFTQAQELTGSPIASDKPIGMFGGASCLNIPTSNYACDGSHQQVPPIKALGSRYAAVRYRNRTGAEESPPWRLIGAVEGTTLTYVPAKPPGAPDVIGVGQVAEFTSPGPFVVSSQDGDHPFYLGAYMTGCQGFEDRGDPEWVNVVPTAQYQDRYVFFTDPTYPETSLVVVRNRKDGVFADVTLACAGVIGGWAPLGDDHEWARVTLVTGNFQDQGACSNGRHTMSSPNPFGVTVWGWGSYASEGFNSVAVSYAYPAGAALKAINDVVVLPQ